jgi:hypothetical protein
MPLATDHALTRKAVQLPGPDAGGARHTPGLARMHRDRLAAIIPSD